MNRKRWIPIDEWLRKNERDLLYLSPRIDDYVPMWRRRHTQPVELPPEELEQEK